MNFKNLNASTAFLLVLLFGVVILISSVVGAGSNGFTAQEKEAVAKLRPLVADILYKSYMQNDWYLLIWLKATFLDVAKTEKMLRQSYSYRMENNIDTISSDKSFDRFDRDLPFKVGGRDREGRPILVLFHGNWNVRKFVLSSKRKEYNLQFVRASETCSELARKEWNSTTAVRGRRTTPDFITIADLGGYTLREGGCLACLPALYEQALDWDRYYPDNIKMNVINTPRIFESVLSVVRQIVSMRAKNAIVVYGNNTEEWTKELHKIISPEQLKFSLVRPEF